MIDMDKTKKERPPVLATYTVPDHISPVAILGPRDQWLDMIKEDAQARVKIQDSKITVFAASDAEASRIVSIFEALETYADLGTPIRGDDVLRLIAQSHNGGVFTPQASDVILRWGKQTVRAQTQKQKQYAEMIETHAITFAMGPAGCAKTFIATVTALKLLKLKEIDQIIVTRAPVALDGMDLGYTPGTAEEKQAQWLGPILDVLRRFLSPDKIKEMIDRQKIRMIPLAYLRGYSFERSMVLVDEAQNLRLQTFKSVCTRLGAESRLVLCGDEAQSDLRQSGFETAATILKDVHGVGVMRFDHADIVRSGITADVIKAFDRYGY